MTVRFEPRTINKTVVNNDARLLATNASARRMYLPGTDTLTQLLQTTRGGLGVRWGNKIKPADGILTNTFKRQVITLRLNRGFFYFSYFSLTK